MKLSSALLLSFACVSAVLGETNLALNPSFEQADAKGVLVDDWITRDGIAVERVTSGGHTGQAFMRFKDDSPTGGQFLECRRVPARPGGQYTASAWLRTGDKCRPGVYLNFYDMNGHRIANRYERTKGSAAEWQRVVVQDTALLAGEVSVGAGGVPQGG